MKKIFSIFNMLILILAIVSCDGNKAGNKAAVNEDKAITVENSTTPVVEGDNANSNTVITDENKAGTIVATSYSNFAQSIIKKIEDNVELTQDQKDKIAKLANTSGLQINSEKSDAAKASFKKLMSQIRSEILTTQQQKTYKKG